MRQYFEKMTVFGKDLKESEKKQGQENADIFSKYCLIPNLLL